MSIKKSNKKKAHTNPVNYYNAFRSTVDFLDDVPQLSSIGKESNTLKDSNGCVYSPLPEPPGFYRLSGEPAHKELADDMIYSRFELLQVYRFDGNFNATATFVTATVMDKGWPYMLVGNDIYKMVQTKGEWGNPKMELKPYKRETITLLETKSGLDRTAQNFFEGFCVLPDNKNHVQVDGNCYNLYRPFQHKPSGGEVRADDVSYTLGFFKHIFGDQLHLGLQYFKVLYEQPGQMLPILVLVSRDRHTGKTTFLDYLSMVFGDNFVQVMATDIMGDFNAHYAYANIMGIDETIVDKVHAVEKVKSLVTSRRILVNDKWIKSYTIPFFGKIVMTSNKVTDFMKVDTEEIRFWVRKLTSFGKIDPKFFTKIYSEIPDFIKYVETNVAQPEYKSRMVFSPADIENEYLQAVKEESKSSLCKDIEIRTEEFLLNHDDIEAMMATPTDIKKAWYQNDSRITLSYIRKVIKDEIGIEPEMPKYYQQHLLGRSGGTWCSTTGRCYQFRREVFCTYKGKEKSTNSIDFDDKLPF